SHCRCQPTNGCVHGLAPLSHHVDISEYGLTPYFPTRDRAIVSKYTSRHRHATERLCVGPHLGDSKYIFGCASAIGAHLGCVAFHHGGLRPYCTHGPADECFHHELPS